MGVPLSSGLSLPPKGLKRPSCASLRLGRGQAPLQPESRQLYISLPKELLRAGFAEICFYKLFLPVQQVKEL